MSENIDLHRRRFFGTAAMGLAAAQFAPSGSAEAQSGKAKAVELRKIKPGTNTSFAYLKQVDAGVLNVGYAEAGPAGGPAVILLHGWPYDIHSYVDVAPLLASAGYRVIVRPQEAPQAFAEAVVEVGHERFRAASVIYPTIRIGGRPCECLQPGCLR
jgi:hypothetical protein